MQPLEWLTLALVVMTAFYAVQTQRMVREMRATRAVAVLPKVVPSMTYLAQELAMPSVVNAGPGPALGVHVEMWVEPGKGYGWEWRAPVMASGEVHQFFFKSGGGLASMSAVLASYTTLVIHARYGDALGERFDSVERLEMSSWWKLLLASGERNRPDYVKKISDSLDKIAKNLRG